MSDEERQPEPPAPEGMTANRIDAPDNIKQQRYMQRLEITADRRRKGRSGSYEEWQKAVVITLGKPVHDGIEVSKLHLRPFIMYLDSRGLFERFAPFMPEDYWIETGREIIRGEHPTPRFFSTLAIGYDFMDVELRERLQKMYAHYLKNDDPDKEFKYFSKLLPYNPFTAHWVRSIWAKSRKTNSTPKERKDQFERDIRTSDMSGSIAKMMSIVLNENMQAVFPDELVERIGDEGDPFEEQPISDDLFDVSDATIPTDED